MTFTAELRESLQERTSIAPVELATGETLENVLNRHLLAVESSAETVLLTSILLVDDEGKRLRHAAAPSLPKAYCEAIDGVEIGPGSGSCGTAAHFGHAIYVTDIAADPLWRNYRDAALPHGLRACWSTPIHDPEGSVAGTFAIYHLTPRSPTREEVAAIAMITDHVEQAIHWSRSRDERSTSAEGSAEPNLRVVSDLDRELGSKEEPTVHDVLSSIESDFGALARIVGQAIEARTAEGPPDEYLERLIRLKAAAERGATLARGKSKR